MRPADLIASITPTRGAILYRQGEVVLVRFIVREPGQVFRYESGGVWRNRPPAALMLRYRSNGDWYPCALRIHATRATRNTPTGYAMTPKVPDGPERVLWWLNETEKLGLALEAQLGPGHSSMPLETDHE